MKLIKNLQKLIILIVFTALIAGCAVKPNTIDPYEKFNRFTFKMNMGVDRYVYRPIALVYSKVVPPPLQTGIRNVFDNISELTTLPNDILQGKIKWALVDIWRFVINSTIGIGGLFDVATHMGLPRHYEDFGLTIAYWGGGKHRSPYLMLPLLGPTTFRAAFGTIVDTASNPFVYIRPRAIKYWALGIRYLNIRSLLLPSDRLIRQSFDPYIFVRNAYLQQRERLIKENEHS